MAAMICTIQKDGMEGEQVFFVRFWKDVRDIGFVTPEDTWEVKAVVPDKDTMTYLDDQRILEKMRGR